MDDGLAPTCKKIAGPNRVAYRAGQRELRRLEMVLQHKRQMIRQAEDEIASLSRAIRAEEGERLELLKSLEILEQGD